MPVSPKDVGVEPNTEVFVHIDAVLSKPWSAEDRRDGRRLSWLESALSDAAQRKILFEYEEVGWDVDRDYHIGRSDEMYVVFTFCPPQVRA